MSLSEITSLSASLDAFMELHKDQLENVICLPKRLWAPLWAKIESGRFGTQMDDSTTVFALNIAEDGENETLSVSVVAAKDLSPPMALIVFNHDWTFTSKEQAEEHLKASIPLQESLQRTSKCRPGWLIHSIISIIMQM
jgi:hypothetical protein